MDNNNEIKNAKGILEMIKKLKKTKVIVIVSSVIAGFLLLVGVFYVIIRILTSLASLHSLERAGANRLSGDTDYEKQIIERDLYLNFTEYFDLTNEKQTENHEKYFDALYDAYQLYKSGVNPLNWWDDVVSFFKNLFVRSYRRKLAPLYPEDSSTKMYNVQIDTTLITATLYNNRFQSEMYDNDEFDAQYSYFVEQFGKGYDLHTGSYRDFVENNYLYDSKQSVDSKYHMSATKKAIEGIEVLSKYQIKRIETYLTIQPSFVGIYTDTTRHIELVLQLDNSFINAGCVKYLGDSYGNVMGPDQYYNRSIQHNGGYQWQCDPEADAGCRYCREHFNLSIYDDDLYCYDNELTDTSDGALPFHCKETDVIKYSKGDIGMDAPLQYELACEDYNEYLLGNLPTDKDVKMFCGVDAETGMDNCYCNRFIESYYHQYVDDNDVDEKRRDIGQIVFETYSLYDYYENSTNIHNVCSNAEINTTSYRDLSCEGTRKTKYHNNDYYEEYVPKPEIDYDYIEDLLEGVLTDSSFNEEIVKKLIAAAMEKVGLPYVWGGNFCTGSACSVGGDCSGLIYSILNQAGINIGRTNAQGYYEHFKNSKVNLSDIQPGDLLFWSDKDSSDGKYIDHTGIYIGDGKIIDASSGNGKVVERELWGTSPNSTYPLVGAARPY